MEYISAGNADECVRRVTIRADRGGHSAPPSRVRATYAASMTNLLRALEMQVVRLGRAHSGEGPGGADAGQDLSDRIPCRRGHGQRKRRPACGRERRLEARSSRGETEAPRGMSWQPSPPVGLGPLTRGLYRSRCSGMHNGLRS